MDDLLTLKKKTISILPGFDLSIKEQTLFKADGGEGLHLWEASVIMGRYLVTHKEKVEGKSIIELGCGCGLMGMSVMSKCSPMKYTFTDYNKEVLKNLEENIKINNIKNMKNYEIITMDWRDYEKVKEKYDLIIGAELIYQGGCIQELAKIIKKLLKKDGVCLISMPEKRSMTNMFLEFIQKEGLKYNKEYYENMDNADLLFKPIMKENNKLFENLKEMKQMIYTIYY